MTGPSRIIEGPAGKVRIPYQAACIFDALQANPGTTIQRRDLCAALWSDSDDYPEYAESQISVIICRLRRALRLAGAPIAIRSHFGVGYVLVADAQRETA